MKKYILTIAILIGSVSVFAQNKDNVELKKQGDLTVATYFYEDGSVQQQGAFNEKGELHGIWTSFDLNGDKLTSANYDNGKKVGKWVYWIDNSVKEVNYKDNVIVSVNEVELQ